MAAPFEIRKEIRRVLGKTAVAMTKPRWILALEGKPETTRRRAARLMLEVSSARLRVTNALLADLRDDLVANETRIEAGTKKLETALERLTKTREVLDATAAFLQILARLAALAAKA